RALSAINPCHESRHRSSPPTHWRMIAEAEFSHGLGPLRHLKRSSDRRLVQDAGRAKRIIFTATNAPRPCRILLRSERTESVRLLGQPPALIVWCADEGSSKAISRQRRAVQRHAIRGRPCASAVVCHDAERAGLLAEQDDQISAVVRYSG